MCLVVASDDGPGTLWRQALAKVKMVGNGKIIDTSNGAEDGAGLAVCPGFMALSANATRGACCVWQ